MPRVDKSTQTPSFRSFRIREMPQRFKRIFKRKLTPNPSLSISKKPTAEEYVLDAVLSKGCVKVRNGAINVFIKGLFDTDAYLAVKEGRLCLTIDCLFKTFKSSIENEKEKSLVDEFEATIVNVLVYNSCYFDEFFRVREQNTYPILQLIAIFLVYLARFIEKKLYSCVFDFFFQLFYHLRSIHQNKLEEHFIHDYVEKRQFSELEAIEKEYKDSGREWPFHFFKQKEILSLFCDFCSMLSTK